MLFIAFLKYSTSSSDQSTKNKLANFTVLTDYGSFMTFTDEYHEMFQEME